MTSFLVQPYEDSTSKKLRIISDNIEHRDIVMEINLSDGGHINQLYYLFNILGHDIDLHEVEVKNPLSPVADWLVNYSPEGNNGNAHRVIVS